MWTKRRKELTSAGGGLEEGRERCGGGQGPVSPLCWLSLFPIYCCSLDEAERKPVEPTGAGGDDFAGSFCRSWAWVFNPFCVKKIGNKKKKVTARLAGCAQFYFKETTTYHQPAPMHKKFVQSFIVFILMDFFTGWSFSAKHNVANYCIACKKRKRKKLDLKISYLKTWESDKNVLMFSVWVPLNPDFGRSDSAGTFSA